MGQETTQTGRQLLAHDAEQDLPPTHCARVAFNAREGKYHCDDGRATHLLLDDMHAIGTIGAQQIAEWAVAGRYDETRRRDSAVKLLRSTATPADRTD